MSSTLIPIITSMCISLTPTTSHDACSHALEAGFIQSGISQAVDQYQNTLETKSLHEAESVLGQDGLKAASGIVYIAKVVTEKSVKFNVHPAGICDNIVNEIGVDKYAIKFEWHF